MSVPDYRKIIFFFLLLLSAASVAQAACLVVTPSGSGSKTGADWNNALAGLPWPLTSGNTYYLADGSYGRQGDVSQTGTSRTTVKKAIATDNCTSTGWNTSTMGSAQAVFTALTFDSGGAANNITFDGNGTSTQPGCGASPATTAYVPASDCGIKIDDSACTGGADACDGPIGLSVYQGKPVTGLVLRYMEWVGNGSNDTGNNREQNFLNAPQTNGPASWTMQHIYGHETGCVYWQDYASPTYLIEYSYLWANWSNPNACHGQLTYDYGSQNSIFRYNIVRDIEGTAVFTWDDGANTSNIWIYGNIFYYTSNGAVNGQSGTSNATFTAGNPGSSCTNCHFYNNTFANMNYSVGFLANESGASVITAENNLFYQATTKPGGGTGSPGGVEWSAISPGSVSATENYNTCIYSGSCGGGGNDVVVTGQTPVPFVGWTNNINETVNFALTGQNSYWSAGLNLGTGIPSAGLFPCTEGVNCVDSDMLGHTRTTWDRGALEYAAGGTPPPPPPPTTSACDVNGDGAVNVLDVQLEVNLALGITTPCPNADGCTVVQVQRVVNAALGGTCVAP